MPTDDPGRTGRPSPGSSDPGEPGYEGAVTIGDDAFEGLEEPPGEGEDEPGVADDEAGDGDRSRGSGASPAGEGHRP